MWKLRILIEKIIALIFGVVIILLVAVLIFGIIFELSNAVGKKYWICDGGDRCYYTDQYRESGDCVYYQSHYRKNVKQCGNYRIRDGGQ